MTRIQTLIACMILLFATNAALATPASGLPPTAPENAGMSSDRLTRIDEMVQRYIEELVAIMLTQVRPYNHMNIREDFHNVVNQAVID